MKTSGMLVGRLEGDQFGVARVLFNPSRANKPDYRKIEPENVRMFL